MEHIDRDSWRYEGLTGPDLADGTDADLLMFAQTQGRPLDPRLFRELERRGLVGRLDALGRQPVPEGER